MSATLGGLLAALAFGAGDFFAGVASRRDPPLRVLALAHPPGALILGVLAFGLGQPLPSASSLGWGMAASVASLGASLLLMRALALGPLGAVSVAAGTLSTGVPVAIGLLLGEHLGVGGWLGACAAMIGMALLSFTPAKVQGNQSQGIRLGIVAGLAVGLFSVLLGQAQPTGMLWTLCAARLTSSLIALPLALRQVGLRPAAPHLIWATVPADSLGIVFFLLALKGGGLALGSLLAHLSPAFTTLLAVTVLRERLRPMQWAGVGLSLLGAGMLGGH